MNELLPEFFGRLKKFSNFSSTNHERSVQENKHMKTLTKFIIAAFAVAILPAFALTANAAPGDIFVSDGARAIIDKIAPDGTVTRFAQAPDVGGITGLAFDSAGNLFEADYSSGTIYKYAPDGTRATFATGLNNPLAAPFPTAKNRTFDLATGAETTTSP